MPTTDPHSSFNLIVALVSLLLQWLTEAAPVPTPWTLTTTLASFRYMESVRSLSPTQISEALSYILEHSDERLKLFVLSAGCNSTSEALICCWSSLAPPNMEQHLLEVVFEVLALTKNKWQQRWVPVWVLCCVLVIPKAGHCIRGQNPRLWNSLTNRFHPKKMIFPC